MRTGVAELPLHSGRTPRWLFNRMVELSGAILDYMSFEYSPRELLIRLSNPFWFQALSCVLGFDWHSSGTTTTTLGALKQACQPERHALLFAGGKGRASRRAPEEIESVAGSFCLSSSRLGSLKRSSSLSAKVDSACVQDGYELYHHSFILAEDGEWGVVQQGMLPEQRYARRYHWLSLKTRSFVVEPHEAILGQRREEKPLDLTAKNSGETRQASLDIAKEEPSRLARLLSRQKSLDDFFGMPGEIRFPRRHGIRRVDISSSGWKALERASEFQPGSYEELIAIPGMGLKTLRALALLSELLFGAESSWRDPVKYSFAHGGKDGIPYPVDRKTYEESTGVLRNALQEAKLGSREKHRALKRLNSTRAQL